MVNVQDHLVLQTVSEGKHIRANSVPVETHYRSLSRFVLQDHY